MNNFKIGVKFDIELLNKLKNTDNSVVEIHNRKHHVALEPIHLNDFNKSIKDLLNTRIAKYNKNLGGILLGYQNIKLPSDIGLINYDSCGIHMDLEADFFIFKPEIGKEMQGVVNRKSKDHVGVLVYNVFNVSLPKPHDEADEDWLGSSINIGDEVLFRITNMNLSSYLPYIKGELMSIISTTAVSTVEDKYLMNNKKRINKKIIFDVEPSPEEARVLESSLEEKTHVGDLSESRRKGKKRKFDTSEEIDQEQEILVPHLQNKKKKHKRESELEENVPEEQISISQVQKKKKHKNEDALEENVQEQEIAVPHSQKKKKYKNEDALEEHVQEQESAIPHSQKKKRHKIEAAIEENILEQEITQSHSQKKKHKGEGAFEENIQEQEIAVPHSQKKKKIKNEVALEENVQEQEITVAHSQKTKKHKHENGTDEDTKIQKKTKKKKDKVRRGKSVDESSLTDFNLSELFNETQIPLQNIKTEMDSDENLENNKLSQKKHFPKKSENNHRAAEADQQNNMIEWKSKTKKQKFKEEVNELSQDLFASLSGESYLGNNISVGNIKYEHSNNDLESFINNSKSRKFKKRRHSSFVELDSPNKKLKRESS